MPPCWTSKPSEYCMRNTGVPLPCKAYEDARSRDLRIFGGWEDDGGKEEAAEMEGLKAPMLEVVKGLFGGIDDEDWSWGLI